MRYHPNTLGEARELADRLNYDARDGGLGTDFCPNCKEKLFVAEGRGADGRVSYGYCLTPGCGFERLEDEADAAQGVRLRRTSTAYRAFSAPPRA